MTIKDVAQQTGLTNAAIYKRLKNKGVKLEAIKDRKTGQFTPDGVRLMIELFGVTEAAKPAENEPKKPVENEVEKLTTELKRLTTEVEKLTTQVELLTNERDNLRAILEREQQLHAMTLTKLLPAGENAEKGRFRAAWDVLRGRR